MFRRRGTNAVAGDCAKRRPDLALAKRNRRKRKWQSKGHRAPSLSQIDELVTIDQLRVITARTVTQHSSHSPTEPLPMWQATNSGSYSVSDNRDNHLLSASTQGWRNLTITNVQSTNGGYYSESDNRDNHLPLASAQGWRNLTISNVQPTNGGAFSVSGDRDNQNHLPSTQGWRNILLLNNETQDAPLLISEEIFRENVNDLLNGIDECAENPAEWSREHTNSYFDMIQRFLDSWKRQLMQEKEKMDLEVLLIKRKLENKNELVTNRLSILTGVFHESMIMEFSEFQKQQMQSQVEELNDVRSRFGESGQLVLSESALATELKTTNYELIEARKQANEYHEELRKMQDSLKEANLKLNNLMHTNNPPTQIDQQMTLEECLQEKENELNELKNQLDVGAKKQTKTENELIETREQFKSFVVKSVEMTQIQQKEVNKMLYEIQTSLQKKNPEYKPSRQTEDESLNQKRILQDIKALIKYDLRSGNNCKKFTTESGLETNCGSASFRVSEYEMHLVNLISTFLKVTPFSVKSSYIHSYVANIDNIVDLQFVENLLQKFPSFFKEVPAVPGSMEKTWTYLDLKPVITI